MMMHNEYARVTTRFLRDDERFVLSEEKEMPLVIEAQGDASSAFLEKFLAVNAVKLVEDLAKFGAVLLRGFAIHTDKQFEQAVLSIPEFRGISDAFMSENGRTRVDDLKFVLHTNSVYKTGGTLYLGGFHTENYYSADVPGYISFCCLEPSTLGGETGIINTEKIYRDLSEELQQKLEKSPYFVCQWLVSEVAARYQITPEQVRALCQYFDLPLAGEGEEQFILLYKPSVFLHPLTKEKALQINLFEVPTLNYALRKCFMKDYQGKTWFWHRFFWKLPTPVFNAIEFIATLTIAFFNSPKNSYKIVRNRLSAFRAKRKNKVATYSTVKVGSCFSDKEIKDLAQSMRRHYSSCIWQKGDILLVDNRKVMHAGMPGMGARTIRAMICNPVAMPYSANGHGCIDSQDRTGDSIGAYMTTGTMPS